MTGITLKNFRCFGYEQSAPLAPLTLLVGENSSGKTSFMAMIRALWDLVFNGDEPNLNKLPYDLGSFDEIVCDTVETNNKARYFGASCSLELECSENQPTYPYQISAEFQENWSISVLRTLRVSCSSAWIECAMRRSKTDNTFKFTCGVNDDVWEVKSPPIQYVAREDREEYLSSYVKNYAPLFHWIFSGYHKGEDSLIAHDRSNAPSPAQLKALRELAYAAFPHFSRYGESFASAPVQSFPQRTYELSQSIRDIEGRHVPNHLAYLYDHGGEEWHNLKAGLEDFGRSSGLFDKISIKKLGNRGGDPFQVEIGLSQGGMVLYNRNLLDVGYGVSQALPVLTEVMRRDARHLLLFQQPEVHLHPRAQAALGSLFCKIAGMGRQIIVETHSDYILDRVRMDIRDQECKLQHEDVAILFFDRSGPSVTIHRIHLDTAGNIVDPPPSYRQFFMQETNRLIGY